MDTNLYYVFISPHYYPLGGWYDYKGSFVTLKSAIEYIMHVDDTHTGKRAHIMLNNEIVWEGSIDCWEEKWEIEKE